MTLEELGERVRSIMPDAVFSVDDSGELIIATRLRLDDEENLVSM